MIENCDRFTFFRSFWEAVKLLPDAERGEYLCKVMACTFDGAQEGFEGIQKLAWTLMEPNIESSAKQARTNGDNRRGTSQKSTEETAQDGSGNSRRKGSKSTQKTAQKSTEETAPLNMDMEGDMDMEEEGNGLSSGKKDHSPSVGGGAAAGEPAPPPPVCSCGEAMVPTNSYAPNHTARYWACPRCGEKVPVRGGRDD